MDAAVLHTLGKPPRYEQFPEPIAGEGEVIVHVRAAALKPVDKQLASGWHYASPRELPIVSGSDGAGHLDDGTRVFFGRARPPYGAMAQRTVVPRAFCFPVPEGVDYETAAALPNPGVSAWLSLVFRAKLAPGENVLILGATGVAGKLAVKIAKLLGARRVVAAGRNEQVLSTLHKHGADAVIRLDKPPEELSDAFANEVGNAAPGRDRLRVGSPHRSIPGRDNTQGICRCHIRDSPGASWRERRGNHLASSRRAAQHGPNNPRDCRDPAS